MPIKEKNHAHDGEASKEKDHEINILTPENYDYLGVVLDPTFFSV